MKEEERFYSPKRPYIKVKLKLSGAAVSGGKEGQWREVFIFGFESVAYPNPSSIIASLPGYQIFTFSILP